MSQLKAADSSLKAGVDFWEPAQIHRHIGNPLSLPMADPRTKTFSCIDGRETTPAFTTPAGDAGEMVLALGVLYNMSRELGNPLLNSFSELESVVHSYLNTLPPERQFYMHTDGHALEHFLEEIGITEHETFEMATLPVSKRARALELLVESSNIGCGHLKYCLSRPIEYGVVANVTKWFIQSFFTYMWRVDVNKTRLSYDRSETYPALPGDHTEKAIIILTTDYSRLEYNDVCLNASPQISPFYIRSGVGSSVFVAHDANARSSLRLALAGYATKLLVNSQPVATTTDAVLARMNALAGKQVPAEEPPEGRE